MSPLMSPIYVHSEVDGQWYHLRSTRFENQIEFLTKKRPLINSIFSRTAAAVGSLSGIGMIVGGAVKSSMYRSGTSDSNPGYTILPIVGAVVLMVSSIWALYQRCHCNHLSASKLELNRDLDSLFCSYKGTANFGQIFTPVDRPNPDSKFKFEVDVAGEIRPSLNEGGCCLVSFDQN